MVYEKGRRGRPMPSGKASTRILKKIIWGRIWSSQTEVIKRIKHIEDEAYQVYEGKKEHIQTWPSQQATSQRREAQPAVQPGPEILPSSLNIQPTYKIYVHLEVSEVAVSKWASSEATEDPSDSTNHQLDHPNHDVGRAEMIEIIWVIDMFVIVSGSL